MHGQGGIGESAKAFDRRQTVRDLCINGRHDCRVIDGRGVECACVHAALTDEFESANSGSWNVERINGLIYATVMDLRGIYMSAEKADVAKYADSLVKVTDQISAVIADWQRGVRNNDALAFSNFAVRINDYQDSLYKLAPIAKQSGPQAAREWPDKNRSAEIRAVLSKDLAALSQHYTDRAGRIYTQIDRGICRQCISQDSPCRRIVVGSIRQCARYRFGRG